VEHDRTLPVDRSAHIPSAGTVVADLLTAAEAAALLHLHVKRVQLLARQGEIPAIRHGRRWLFRRSELMRGRQPRAGSRGRGAVDLSARNQLVGRVRSVVREGLMAEVTLAIAPQELVAVITSRSVDRLGLAPGVEAVAVVKSTEVMIGTRPPAGGHDRDSKGMEF
jgi:molybdopterin-binding protein